MELPQSWTPTGDGSNSITWLTGKDTAKNTVPGSLLEICMPLPIPPFLLSETWPSVEGGGEALWGMVLWIS